MKTNNSLDNGGYLCGVGYLYVLRRKFSVEKRGFFAVCRAMADHPLLAERVGHERGFQTPAPACSRPRLVGCCFFRRVNDVSEPVHVALSAERLTAVQVGL
jgi:hypothetical protein